ncbi:MAG: hypothetical protein V4733_03745 [Verrucomicrobiota bacterium]
MKSKTEPGRRKSGPAPAGLGDVVAAFAQPIARAIDSAAGTDIQNCGGCKQRREKLNRVLSFQRRSKIDSGQPE